LRLLRAPHVPPAISWHGRGYILAMCGRVIQSSGPLRYAIVDGMNVRDSRVHNYPPRWNAAPSQELLVVRRNHQTGEVSLDPLRWGLIPYWCKDLTGGRKPINAKCETVRQLSFRCRISYMTNHDTCIPRYHSGETDENVPSACSSCECVEVYALASPMPSITASA
jgi:hypothetical protein